MSGITEYRAFCLFGEHTINTGQELKSEMLRFFGEADGILEKNRKNLLKDKDGMSIRTKTTWEFDRKYDLDDTDGKAITQKVK